MLWPLYFAHHPAGDSIVGLTPRKGRFYFCFTKAPLHRHLRTYRTWQPTDFPPVPSYSSEILTHGPSGADARLGLQSDTARRQPTKVAPAPFHDPLPDARLTRYGAAVSATRLPVYFSSG